MSRLDIARRNFAREVGAMTGSKSRRLLRALGEVPRERFLGPGPWKILRPSQLERGYQLTPDDDPRHLYDNVLVALDPDRGINNGEPAALLRWLDRLDPSPGQRFLHLGCGIGYYTAIVAEAMGTGAVVGVELLPRLAERARRNLEPYRNASVVTGDATEFSDGPFDAIFVNAGATEPLPLWLDQLSIGGRLLVPLTVALPRRGFGGGRMLQIVRESDGYSARFVSPVGIVDCAGARSEAGERLLKAAYQRGGAERVRRLRRGAHARGSGCWLHAPRFCLSDRAIDSDGEPEGA
jgi:protein-L-isoaspartate(D-aspartate) O-methyltransferase